MFFDILTLFPEMVRASLSYSIIERAARSGLITVDTYDIRDYSTHKHRCVDDYPYGGGAGMLMRPEPLAKSIECARERREGRGAVIYLSPHGRVLTHSLVEELSQNDGLILLCGHYKGIDHRIVEKYVDMEVSIGDYVLSGGELAASVVVDSVSRLVPGVLGNSESAGVDSHFNGLLSAPAYTRPETFEGVSVPPVLLSGNHKKIQEWEEEQSRALTQEKRPDLWRRYKEKIGLDKYPEV